MTGLSRITDKILDEARAAAAQRLADADAECALILSEYEDKAEKLCANSDADAKAKAAEIVYRAKSSEKALRKSILLGMQSEMTDRAFDLAEKQLNELSHDERLEFLSGLMCASLLEEWEAEKTREDVYGSDEADGARIYEIILNPRDRQKLGESLVGNLRHRLVGKNTGDLADRVRLADDTADIEGGLIIRVGNVEINCSVAAIIKQLRPRLEGQVAKILFPPER